MLSHPGVDFHSLFIVNIAGFHCLTAPQVFFIFTTILSLKQNSQRTPGLRLTGLEKGLTWFELYLLPSRYLLLGVRLWKCHWHQMERFTLGLYLTYLIGCNVDRGWTRCKRQRLGRREIYHVQSAWLCSSKVAPSSAINIQVVIIKVRDLPDMDADEANKDDTADLFVRVWFKEIDTGQVLTLIDYRMSVLGCSLSLFARCLFS